MFWHTAVATGNNQHDIPGQGLHDSITERSESKTQINDQMREEAMRKKEETQRMAEANRGITHFR